MKKNYKMLRENTNELCADSIKTLSIMIKIDLDKASH
jgi:hypothetical protein